MQSGKPIPLVRPMFERFKRVRQEKAIREALTAGFGKRGLDLRPSIRLSSGQWRWRRSRAGACKNREGFARIAAKVAEQDDLPHELKRELVIKAYAAYGERLGREASKK